MGFEKIVLINSIWWVELSLNKSHIQYLGQKTDCKRQITFYNSNIYVISLKSKKLKNSWKNCSNIYLLPFWCFNFLILLDFKTFAELRGIQFLNTLVQIGYYIFFLITECVYFYLLSLLSISLSKISLVSLNKTNIYFTYKLYV